MTLMYFSLSIASHLLRIDHLQAAMRAEARAYPAMAAYNRLFCLVVEVDSAHDAGAFAFAATDAHVLADQHAAPGPLFKGVAWAHFEARRFLAAQAHDRDEAAGHAAG